MPASIAPLLLGDERRRDRRRGRRLERAPAMAATVGVDETSSREFVTTTASTLTDRGRRAHAAATQAQPSGARARTRDLQKTTQLPGRYQPWRCFGATMWPVTVSRLRSRSTTGRAGGAAFGEKLRVPKGKTLRCCEKLYAGRIHVSSARMTTTRRRSDPALGLRKQRFMHLREGRACRSCTWPQHSSTELPPFWCVLVATRALNRVRQ